MKCWMVSWADSTNYFRILKPKNKHGKKTLSVKVALQSSLSRYGYYKFSRERGVGYVTAETARNAENESRPLDNVAK